jgi:hypothetical protein
MIIWEFFAAHLSLLYEFRGTLAAFAVVIALGVPLVP